MEPERPRVPGAHGPARHLAKALIIVALLASPAFGQDLQPAGGIGIRQARIFGFKVYEATLYLERPVPASEILTSPQAKRLSFHFVRNVDVGEIHEDFDEGFRALKKEGEFPAERTKLAQCLTDVKKGDVLALTEVGDRLTVSKNGQPLGEFKSKPFADAVLAIWLSEQTPFPAVRQGIVGTLK